MYKKTYIAKAIDRARFFQKAQVYPLNKDLNAEKWIANFPNESEQFLACHMLNFFCYYSEHMIDEMLRAALNRAGEELIKHFPKWTNERYDTDCVFSKIPGEQPSITDSSHLLLSRVKRKCGVPDSRFLDFFSLQKTLEQYEEKKAVVFIDDFVGTGAQCDTAWHNMGHESRRSMSEYASSCDHVFIYVPLIANYTGKKRIVSTCEGLDFSPLCTLGEEYSLFSENCLCWDRDKTVFEDGIDLIKTKSTSLGILDTNGISIGDWRGFGNQGLAMAFAHSCPDAVIPLFYFESSEWLPLITSRSYQ